MQCTALSNNMTQDYGIKNSTIFGQMFP